MIAGEMDRSVREVERKISVSRSPYQFVLAKLKNSLGHADSGRILRAVHLLSDAVYIVHSTDNNHFRRLRSMVNVLCLLPNPPSQFIINATSLASLDLPDILRGLISSWMHHIFLPASQPYPDD